MRTKPKSFKGLMGKTSPLYFCYFSPPSELNNGAQQHGLEEEEAYLGGLLLGAVDQEEEEAYLLDL
jgi:hypothetical protein